MSANATVQLTEHNSVELYSTEEEIQQTLTHTHTHTHTHYFVDTFVVSV